MVVLEADLVVSNADYATMMRMLPSWCDLHSGLGRALQALLDELLVLYFGFEDDPFTADLRHHNIILGPRYSAAHRDLQDEGPG